jgi:hypothetical protein
MIEIRNLFKGFDAVAFPAVGVQLSLVKVLVAREAFIGNGFVKHSFAEPTGEILFFLLVAFIACKRGVFSL